MLIKLDYTFRITASQLRTVSLSCQLKLGLAVKMYTLWNKIKPSLQHKLAQREL